MGFPLSFFFVLSLVRIHFLREGLGGGHKGNLQRAASRGLRTGKLGKSVHRHDLSKSHASMNKQKKKKPRTQPQLQLSFHYALGGAKFMYWNKTSHL